MITGSNTNVRHRGKLFHVQTEDSGRRNPHVISHVYYRGTILASENGPKFGMLIANCIHVLRSNTHQPS